MISSRSQVEVTPGMPGAGPPAAAADKADGSAARRMPVSHPLTRASVVLLLILFAGSSALSIRAYALSEQAASTTSNTIESSDDLLIELLDAETGQRGYLLTGTPAYLQPYDAALSAVPGDLQRLDSQGSGIPGSGPSLVELKGLVAVKMTELGRTIDLARAGDHAGALRIVDTNEGKRVMDNARGVIGGIQRAAVAAGTSRRSSLHIQLDVFAILAVLLAAADLSGSLFLRRRLRRAAEEIGSLNASLEGQVQLRTAHLEQANQALQVFAYSIAHDLRTPLRAMSGYAEALAEEYGGQLGETGVGYTGRIRAAAEHMAALIDDLLSLAQVTQATMNLQDVDLSAEVTAICDQLRDRDPGRQVRVTVQEGVWVAADRVLIRSALENLLENAWKFTARRDDAAIEFATAPVGDASVCCYVRDNGAGFDPAYADKLFKPFQRLHRADEYPGTGIGLASVRRIIERHGGRTWAEGSLDRGATIYFTLKAKGSHE